MPTLAQRPNVTVTETIDDESIVINLVTGDYHRIAGVASRLWVALESPVALADWAGAAGVSPAPSEAALAAFALGLADAGLIEPGAAARQALASDADPGAAEAAGLAVESYDDMADLLAIDPVHETDDLGWPKAAEG